jgi:Flp pilus assembly CpaF family ATPase
MQASTSVLVSGPPGAGKTSFLSALIASVPIDHCIRACEEIRELHVPIVHGSYYEARPPTMDGSGEISLRHLVKATLAMRPDLIVVGEVRGAEAFELTRAMNAGCGFACTIHANSATDALHALVNAALMAGENVTERVVRKVFASSIDLVVHLERDVGASGGGIRRETMEIRALVPSLHDDFSSEPLFSRDQLGSPMEWTGAMPPDSLVRRLDRVLRPGLDLGRVMQGDMSW